MNAINQIIPASITVDDWYIHMVFEKNKQIPVKEYLGKILENACTIIYDIKKNKKYKLLLTYYTNYIPYDINYDDEISYVGFP